MGDECEQKHLDVIKVIGYSGHVINGLKCHPDRHHLIYSVGMVVIIENIDDGHQWYFEGHTNIISCLEVSISGKYIATGQISHSGFKADIIVWNYEQKCIHCQLTLHRDKVEALAFSFDDEYLFSIGGINDGSLVAWSMLSREAICGFPLQLKSQGTTHCITTANQNNNLLITAGRQNLRIWRMDSNKLLATNVQTNKIMRVYRSIAFSADDTRAYLGTTTGDVIIIDVVCGLYIGTGLEKLRFSCGIMTITLLPTSEFLIGAGDGTIAIISASCKRTNKQCMVDGPITSVSVHGSSAFEFYVGTSKANIYKFKYLGCLECTKIKTSHESSIRDMAFPYNCCKLLVTGGNTVRIWYTPKFKELVCISVANHFCNSLAIMKNGSCIVTGWTDACIRGYFPETGRPMFVVKSTYGSEVTALATTHNCDRVISGSDFGHLVIWTIPPERYTKDLNYVSKHELIKDHIGRITSICVLSDDTEMVSSSEDGSCLVWNLCTLTRKHMLKMNTLFKQVTYHADEQLIVTCGSNRMVGFWERFDGSNLRALEGSRVSCINAIDVNGCLVVAGGDDKILRVWRFEDGEFICAGVGHSAPITRVKICPQKSCIISSGSDGSIFVWKYPIEVCENSNCN